MRVSRITGSILITTVSAAVLALAPRNAPAKAAGLPDSLEGPIVTMADGPVLSPPASALPEVMTPSVPGQVHPVLPLPPIPVLGSTAPGADAAVQTEILPQVDATVGLNFDGISFAQGGTGVPPDTNGAVGLTQYVQTVNGSFAVFDSSSGAVTLSPRHINLLFGALGGDCASRNDGDPVVLYDRLADRWVITQFALGPLSSGAGNFLQCVAVSTSGDATGSYNLYAFSFGNDDFIDYGKFGSWPDAYYGSFNTYNQRGTAFKFAKACAFDRTAMQGGAPATMVCFNDPMHFGFLPADFDGTIPPPAGSPNPFLNILDSSDIGDSPFVVDFVTPSNSTFGPITPISVVPFSEASVTPVPQRGIAQLLDSLGDRLMFRNAYRTDGTNEFLVVNHSVNNAGSIGVRWYQFQDPNGTPRVVQQGTFAVPDSNFRWMGSIAMDSAGDLAMGYSVSGLTINPSIRYTGQQPTDPPGTMETEGTIVSGTGSQTTFSRWGDYSAITVDPNDDCTFWYTNEYLTTNGVFNWSTRIASFVFPACQAPPSGITGSNRAAPRRH